MAHNIQRFPSGFVLVERGAVNRAAPIPTNPEETEVERDVNLSSLLNRLQLADKNAKDSDMLLHVGLIMRKYFGKDLRQWVKDQMEYARTDTMHWNFFVEFVTTMFKEDRQLAGWRNVMTRALRGNLLTFSEYASRIDANRQRERPTTLFKVETLEWSGDHATSDMLVKVGDIDIMLFILVIFYGQENDTLSNIAAASRPMWFQAHSTHS